VVTESPALAGGAADHFAAALDVNGRCMVPFAVRQVTNSDLPPTSTGSVHLIPLSAYAEIHRVEGR